MSTLTAILNSAAALGTRAFLSPHEHEHIDGVRGASKDDMAGKVLLLVGARLLLKAILGTGRKQGSKLERREGLIEIPLGAVITALWAYCSRGYVFRATLCAFVPGVIVSTQRRPQVVGLLGIAVTVLLTVGEDESVATLLAALATVTAIRQKLSEKRQLSIDNTVNVAMYAALGVSALLGSWYTSSSKIITSHLPILAIVPWLPPYNQPAIYTLLLLPLAQLLAFPPFSGVDLLPLPLAVYASWPRLKTTHRPTTPMTPFIRPASWQSNPRWKAPLALLPPSWRLHLSTILRTPSSRRIFGFLCLNLAYMVVQMVYGVWTNSLGLISDAIHMLFDCLGIGVGLWASVAATWKPDARYTFGYGRVETLSGFANGCFLILISVFIIFEAVQRVLDPPEMQTKQLLLVSSVGLGINLFGMWATGGHHHHGHGHDDHGHGGHGDHGHGDASTNGNGGGQCGSHGIDHGHGHDHGHDHHSHGHDHSHAHGHDHSTHSHDHSHSHDHDHSHDHAHSHDHPHSHDHAHAHSHTHTHTHAHSPSPSHTHTHEDHHHSHNMRGVFLHVMADTLGSVGVILSTLAIRYTGWTGFDPLASLFIAALILASVIPLVVDAAGILVLDVGPGLEQSIRGALGQVAAIEGVKSYSAARFWPSESGLVGSLHVRLMEGGRGEGRERVTREVEKVLKDRLRVREVVVQVDEGGFCSCMTGGA